MNMLERQVEALCSDPRCSDRCRARWTENYRLLWRAPDGSDVYEVQFGEQVRHVAALGRGPLNGYCEAHKELMTELVGALKGIETPFTRRNGEEGA